MHRLKFISTLPKELKSLPSPIKRITLFIFIYFLGWGMVMPFETLYLNDVLGNYTETALASGFLFFFMAFFSVLVGELSDVIHPKKILLWTLILYLPVGPLILLLDNLTEFFIFRIYHAILATLLWTTCYIYVRKHSPKQKSAESIGLFNAGSGLSTIIGSVAGGILVWWYQDIKILFLIIPIFVFFTILSNLFLPNNIKGVNHESFKEFKNIFNFSHIKTNLFNFLKTEDLPFFSLVAFLFMAAQYSLALLLPLFSESLEANYFQIGIISALAAIPLLFQAPFSIFADRYGKKMVMKTGFFVSGIIFLALIFTNSLLGLAVLAFILSASFSISMPALEGELTKLMPSEQKGKLGGIVEGIMHLGAAFGIFIIGPISDAFGLKSAFLLGFFIMILLLITLSFKNKEPMPSIEKNLTKIP